MVFSDRAIVSEVRERDKRFRISEDTEYILKHQKATYKLVILLCRNWHVYITKGKTAGGKARFQFNCLLPGNSVDAIFFQVFISYIIKYFSISRSDNTIWWQKWLQFSFLALRLKSAQPFPGHMFQLVIFFLVRCLLGLICYRLLINHQILSIFTYFT